MQIITRLMELYNQTDQRVAIFQLKSGLRCIAGCGHCCLTSKVQATILEMLPAANEILLRGEASKWIERIDANAEASICAFYSAKLETDEPGHCGFYTWRPMVCRLFGFASHRNRNGRKLLGVCKVLKEKKTLEVGAAKAIQDEALSFIEASSLIYGLDPGLGTKLLPINIALKKAIISLGLHMQMSSNENLGNTTAA